MLNMDRFDRSFNRTRRFIGGTAIAIIILSLALTVAAIFGIVKGAQYISQHGLKSVTEQIWNGTDSSNGK